MDCVFCSIVSGNIPATKVYEDDQVLAFLDVNPVNDGHTLVIPKQHYATILDIPADQLQAVAAVAKKLAVAADKALHPDGLNLLQSNGAAAGQTVDHFHIHVMPRWRGDHNKLDWQLVHGDPSRLQEVAVKIKAAL